MRKKILDTITLKVKKIPEEYGKEYIILECSQTHIKGWGSGYKQALEVFAKNLEDYLDGRPYDKGEGIFKDEKDEQ